MKKILTYYHKFLIRAEKWLDREIDYINRRLYYIDQETLTRDSINNLTTSLQSQINRLSTSNYDFSVNKQISPNDFSDELNCEITSLSESIDAFTCGVIIESSRSKNLDAIIAAMTHRQLAEPRTRFFIATDNDEIILKLVNVFNWAHRHFYTLPTLLNCDLNPSERNTATYKVLSQIDNFIVSESSSLTRLLNHQEKKFPSFIDVEEVFVFQPSEMKFV